MRQRPHVIIVGGGFGGLEAARSLRRAPVQVTLVDRSNHHLFQPLLYQVATAGLAPADVAEPIRHILARHENTQVLMGNVTDVDLEQRQVRVDGAWMSYDRLILAAGARYSYFGNEEWPKHAPALKTIRDALHIRQRMLVAFEQAEWTEDPKEKRRLLTFVVVGGGPTGVELAGAIAEIARKTMLRDFRHIDTRATRVILAEALDEVLPGYPDPLREKARRYLESLGVEVWSGTPVEAVDEGCVRIGGKVLEAENVLWAAGVEGEPIARHLDVPLDAKGRVRVSKDLTIPGYPDAYVIGDLAYFEKDGEPVPGLAPAAQQMGRHAAQNLVRDLDGKPRRPFHYKDHGVMATVGRRRAVADLPWIRLGGTLGWLLWVFVHIWTLISFRNRIMVLVKWAWAWLTWEHSSRLIWEGLDEPEREEPDIPVRRASRRPPTRPEPPEA